MSLPPSKQASGGAAGGYLHADYAASLAEFGRPHHLPRSGGWILIRRIPSSGHPGSASADYDATGCYPLFACADWSQLPVDLNDLQQDLVTLTAVSDPFGHVDADFLKSCFVDLVRPFKEHFVVDLRQSSTQFVSGHHRRNTRNAVRRVRVETCTDAAELLNDWLRLYGVLIQRHGIQGVARFSAASFAGQLQVPGLVAFRSVHADETVGITLWYVQEGRAYYHLGAYSEAGYSFKASFAMFAHAIEYFRQMGMDWLNLGAGAGLQDDGTDGLSRFKRGWATGTRTAYLCGRIFDRERYDALSERRGVPPDGYFPAYRAGEFS